MDSVETLFNSLLRTTTSVFQTLRLYPIPDKSSVRTDLVVIGRATDGTTASFRVDACCKRVAGGGVVMIEGSESVPTSDIRKDAAASGWNVQANANGNNLEIKVKGDNSHSVDWQITGGISVFSPP